VKEVVAYLKTLLLLQNLHGETNENYE